MKWFKGLSSAFVALVILLPNQLHAQENAKQLAVQLNKLQSIDTACRMTLVMTNKTGVEVESASLELVLFDKDQAVTQLLTVNPGRLPNGKTRVKQFDIEGMACVGIGRVLLNDIKRCDGDGLSPPICLDAVRPSSRIDVPFGN